MGVGAGRGVMVPKVLWVIKTFQLVVYIVKTNNYDLEKLSVIN